MSKATYQPLSFPVSLALVKQQNGQKYLFRIPYERIVEPGSLVVCKTQYDKQPGTVTDVLIVHSQEALDFVLQAARVGRLEPIVARMICYDYGDTATYYAKQRGLRIEKEPPKEPEAPAQHGETASAPDRYITVHLPSGDATKKGE